MFIFFHLLKLNPVYVYYFHVNIHMIEGIKHFLYKNLSFYLHEIFVIKKVFHSF